MFCPNCGTKNSAEAIFCANCGFRLKKAEKSPVTPATDNTPKAPTTDNTPENSAPDNVPGAFVSPIAQANGSGDAQNDGAQAQATPGAPIPPANGGRGVQPKGSKKRWWIGIVAFFVVLGALGTFYYAFYAKNGESAPKTAKKGERYSMTWTSDQSDELDDYIENLGESDGHDYRGLLEGTFEEIDGHNLGKYFEETKKFDDGKTSRQVNWFVTKHLVDKNALQVLSVYLDKTEDVAYAFGVLNKLPVTYLIEADGDDLVLLKAPSGEITKSFAAIYRGEEVESPKRTIKTKKTSPRWSDSKMTELSDFIGDWQEKMGQSYVGTWSESMIDDGDFRFPDIIKDGPDGYEGKITINDRNVDIVWAEKADTDAEWQVVAAAYDKHNEDGVEREITYLFAFNNGKPVALVSEDRGGTRNFTPTRNLDLQNNFAAIAGE